MTIARAKCEGRTVTKRSDAEDAIRIYCESLDTLGLTILTAGEIIGIISDKELEIIDSFEKLVLSKVDFEGLPLSSETLKTLEIECGMRCHGTSLDPEKIFKDAISKVENAL